MISNFDLVTKNRFKMEKNLENSYDFYLIRSIVTYLKFLIFT
jgi:hypothetical protein